MSTPIGRFLVQAKGERLGARIPSDGHKLVPVALLNCVPGTSGISPKVSIRMLQPLGPFHLRQDEYSIDAGLGLCELFGRPLPSSARHMIRATPSGVSDGTIVHGEPTEMQSDVATVVGETSSKRCVPQRLSRQLMLQLLARSDISV